MALRISRARLLELGRYYQVGLVNTAFGFGGYSLLVRLGLNMFASQFLAHCIGVAFNYMTYSHHVFRDAAPAKLRFVLLYGLSYLISLFTLALASLLIASPYLAGFVALVIVSAINYFLLKQFVFRSAAA